MHVNVSRVPKLVNLVLQTLVDFPTCIKINQKINRQGTLASMVHASAREGGVHQWCVLMGGSGLHLRVGVAYTDGDNSGKEV